MVGSLDNQFNHKKVNIRSFGNLRADRYAGGARRTSYYPSARPAPAKSTTPNNSAQNLMNAMMIMNTVNTMMPMVGGMFGPRPMTMQQTQQTQQIQDQSSTGKLQSANDFKSLKEAENEVKSKLETLNTDYQQISEKNVIDGALNEIKGTLEEAGVNLDTKNLSLSELNKDDLDGSLETIDKDIKNYEDFKTDLSNAQQKLSSEMEKCTGNIAKLESQISACTDETQKAELQKQLDEVKAKFEEIKQAKAKLDTIGTPIDAAIEGLNAKKEEISQIKEFNESLDDKKSELAKAKDKELQHLVNKYNSFLTSKDKKAEIKEQLKGVMKELQSCGIDEKSKFGNYQIKNYMDAFSIVGQVKNDDES